MLLWEPYRASDWVTEQLTTSSAWDDFNCGGKTVKLPDPKPFGYETTVINIVMEFNIILFIY